MFILKRNGEEFMEEHTCPLLDNDTCKASGVYCFWGEQPPSAACLGYRNAFMLGKTSGIEQCTERIRSLLEGV